MAQAQYFNEILDAGAFAAYDSDFEYGLWMSLPVNANVIPYGELFYTTKPWVPYLDATQYLVSLRRGNGIQGTLGLIYSPPKLGATIYLEACYNGDGYAESDWRNLGDALSAVETLPPAYAALRAGIYGSVASDFRYGFMSSYYAGFHIKPDSPIAEVLDWSWSLRYEYPGAALSRLTLLLKPRGALEISLRWDALFALDSGATAEDRQYPYTHFLTLVAGIRLDAGIEGKAKE